MKKSKALLILMIAGAVLLTSMATAQADGRLVVWRSPGLGRNVVVGLTIDGRQAADLTYGRHYDQPISPGRHVIAVQAFPRAYPMPPFRVEINVRSGELYNFTAKGGVQQLILK